jgi:tRNA nucleotidyltransferase/poly(A) polymerase
MKHPTAIALMKFLSKVARRLGAAKHIYIVGGAPRNFLISRPIKDLDVVIDSIALKGKDSLWFAKEVRRAIPAEVSIVTNQYGVTILTIKGDWNLEGESLQGEVIEIANARQEEYGEASGKGYKPHMVAPAPIETDILRREFTLNTLLWRLLDLEHGPERAEIIDLLGRGRKDLEEGLLITPVDPDKTFSDDPTRMMRAIKFIAKYGFRIPPDVAASIRKNARKLAQMPWDAVRKILVEDILEGPEPRKSVKLLHDLGLGEVLKDMLAKESGFAAALSRSLNEQEIHLVLDLLDLGWAMRSPVSFLSSAQLERLREILLSNADDPAFEKRFLAELKKPRVDQVRLFEAYQLKGRDRGQIIQIARSLLLENPDLATRPALLERRVEKVVQDKFGRPMTAARVVDRFLGG